MISGILQRLKKQSGMIAVAHRMRDGQVHGRRCLAFPGFVLSDGDDREVRWFSVGNPAGVAGKRRPRCAGNAVKIRWLILPRLDALYIFVSFHIFRDCPIKCIKILTVVRPAVGECLVILMEDGITRHHPVPGAEAAVHIHKHPEVLNCIDHLRHKAYHRRIELPTAFVAELQQIREIHRRGDAVLHPLFFVMGFSLLSMKRVSSGIKD